MGNYTLAELAKATGKKERTVRYYQGLGLLRQPGQIGPGPHYDEDDRLRLRLIGQLQRDGKSLVEIVGHFKTLDGSTLREEAMRGGSALDYVKSVLGEAPVGLSEVHASLASSAAPAPTAAATTSTPWERFEVVPGIELHVRTPISRERRRTIAAHIARARHELEGNS